MGFMLGPAQLRAYLHALGFTACSPASTESRLTCAHIEVQLLDAPRLLARSAQGDVVYLAVLSAAQLEEQLTSLLGYQRPVPSDAGAR